MGCMLSRPDRGVLRVWLIDDLQCWTWAHSSAQMMKVWLISFGNSLFLPLFCILLAWPVGIGVFNRHASVNLSCTFHMHNIAWEICLKKTCSLCSIKVTRNLFVTSFFQKNYYMFWCVETKFYSVRVTVRLSWVSNALLC